MTQNTSIYWRTAETARRAKELAGEQSVSAYLSNVVDQAYKERFPEPPIQATCPTCGQDTTFVFVAYWPSQSDLYRCSHCQKVAQHNTIMSDGHKAEKEKEEAISNE